MRTSACRKSSFRQAVRLSRMCLNFVFFRASLYKSTAARKKRKTQMSRNHQVSGHFIKKIKICLQMINKKLFSDITKRNVSLRRGSGALSTVWGSQINLRTFELSINGRRFAPLSKRVFALLFMMSGVMSMAEAIVYITIVMLIIILIERREKK